MGPPVDLERPTVLQTTRACWARALPATSWEALARQAAQASGVTPQQLASEICTALLSLISDAPSSSSSTSPTTLSYLRHALSSSSHLVKPGQLARRAFELESPAPATLDVALAAVNAALDAYGPGAVTYAATTPEEQLQAVTIAASILSALSSSVGSLQSPTTSYILRFLTHLPLPSSSTSADPASALSALASASSALSSLKPQPSDASFLQQLLEALSSARGYLSGGQSSGTTRPLEKLGCPFNLDDSPLLCADADIAMLMQSIAHPLIFGPSPFSPSTRLAAALRARVVQAPARGSTTEKALECAVLEMLLAGTEEVKAMGGEAERREEGWAFSRMPDLLVETFKKLEGQFNECQDGLQGALESALRRFSSLLSSSANSNSMDLDSSRTPALLTHLIPSLLSRSLISHDVAASLLPSLSLEQPQSMPHEGAYDELMAETHDMEQVKEVLSEMTGPNGWVGQREAARGLQRALTSHASNLDLHSLSTLCSALLELPHAVLECIFLHLEPKELLAPVREFLDGFDTSLESFGDAHPIEGYGKIVLFVEVVLSRFLLHSHLAQHLGTSKGFFAHWLPSAAAVYPLQGLDEESKSAVHGWVEGLFGEGISDELMHSTNPRTLLRVAPTIVRQSLVACQAGVIDLDTLREGLSYFLQELLSFTLPGVVWWLVGEIGRTAPGPAQTTMLDILGVFVFAESLPRPVLELTSASLAELVDKLANLQPPPTVDLPRLRKLVAPFQSVPSAGSAPSTPVASWSTRLSTLLPLALTSSSSTPSLRPALHHLSPTPSSLLGTLIALHQPLLPSSSPEPHLRASRLLRLSAALFSTGGELNSLPFPTLERVVREVLPYRLMELASKEGSAAEEELLGDLLSSALVWAQEVVLVDGGSFVTLDEVVRVVKEVRLLRKGSLQPFLGRLLSFESLVMGSPKLSELRVT